MGVCGQAQPRSRKPFLECYFEAGNEEQKQFLQRLVTSFNSPIEIQTKISDEFNKYYICFTDYGTKSVLQDGGFINTDEMLNTILNQVYEILRKNREENAAS